jgi:hypothetical protein
MIATDRLSRVQEGDSLLNPAVNEVFESMANLCRTSLTATANRYAELTDDAIAVVISTASTIDYCRISETIWKFRVN